MKHRRSIYLIIIVLLLSMTSCSLAKKPERYQAQFLELFDTVTTIIGYAPDKEEFTEFAQSIYNNLKEYHELFDIYNDYEGKNNIKTINDNAGMTPVKVDRKIIDMLLYAKEAYQLTNGKVNVAFGSVLALWHDYREAGIADPQKAQLPPMELLEEKARHTDINNMVINEEESTVFLSDPEMSLDVGAIAKGYATERVAEMAVEEGYYNALLSVGGNIRAIGDKEKSITEGKEVSEEAGAETSEGLAWSVGIQNPDLESEDQYLDILSMKDFSLVSSGDYERYYMVDGIRYHHIIDPETLMPAQYFTAVSIVTRDSGYADALSTAIFNMPYEEGLKLIEGLSDTEALWVCKNGALKYSSGFCTFLKK